jgi:hypothetical protein
MKAEPMTQKRGQSPSVEIDERHAAINRTTQAANWCIRILREFLVVADAPAGIEVPPTCRTAIFENVKGYGFQQQLVQPLNEAAELISSEPIREVLSQIDGEPDRSFIVSIDAWSSSWHHLAFHVLNELAENAFQILGRELVIDYHEATESEIRNFRMTMVGRRVPEDWLDVLYFVKQQWRYRAIKLDLIEHGILRENLQTYGTNVDNTASKVGAKQDSKARGSLPLTHQQKLQRRNDHIKQLCKKHRLHGQWAALARLATESPAIAQLGLSAVTRDVARNAIVPVARRRKRRQ